MNNYWDYEKDDSEGEKAHDGDDYDVGSCVLGSGCPEEDIAQGAVMGELPVAGEAAHQQAVDPGPGAKEAAEEGETQAACRDTVLNPCCHITEEVVALHVLWFLAKHLFRISGSSTSIMIV